MFIALACGTVIGVVITVLPLWRFEAWWIRGLDFPRLQIAILLTALLIIQLALLPWSAASTWLLVLPVLLCLIYQLAWIVVYTPLFPAEVKRSRANNPQRVLRLMTVNVLTPNRNAEALLDLVRRHQPDTLVTVESDQWWQSRLDVLEREYPHSVKCPLDNLYGMHLYSKLKLSESEIQYLVEDDKPSIHALIHLRSGETVRAHFLHPAPPSPTENDGSGERDAELLVVARSIAQSHHPVIVAGDLNDVAWSETTRAFRKISRLLDPRKGRGMFNTYHAKYWFMRWPLDHLFHSDHFTLIRMQRLGGFGSDHFALLTELMYEPARRDEQEAPEASARDFEMANEKQRDESIEPDDVPSPGSKD